jgi:alpha-L-rhamnosidase
VDGRDTVSHFERRTGVAEPIDGEAVWAAQPLPRTDSHVGFVGSFELAEPAEVTIQLLAVNVFRAWLNGDRLMDGPRRFPVRAPSCQEVRRRLPAGNHAVAVHVHAFGERTRILADIEPFMWCRIVTDGGSRPRIEWRAGPLTGYAATGIRSSPLLGWVEWCDTRVDGDWWRGAPPDGWLPPEPRAPGLGSLASPALPPTPLRPLPMKLEAHGRFRDLLQSHELDDPAMQFALIDPHPSSSDPTDGEWYRYDLGRVRNGTVSLVVDAPPATELLIGLGERLYADRFVPVVPLSAGRTCFLSRYLLRGGRQTVEPLASNGVRYVEVRARGGAGIRVLAAHFNEHDGLGEPVGRFECGDPLLERIWQVGLDTLRASADDAIIDPVRERAQWTGDAITVGLEVGAVGWSDLGLFRQVLMQSAECASPDGLVAGCSPGDVIYVATFAAYWIGSCVRYAQLTGDLDLLRELLPAARANAEALRAGLRADGSFQGAWPFVDWGRRIDRGAVDLTLLCILLEAARNLRAWELILGETRSGSSGLDSEVSAILSGMPRLREDPETWRRAGYHSSVWGLRTGLAGPSAAGELRAAVRAHLESVFPNDRDAPRLRHPDQLSDRVATPFFAHFALAELLRAGDVDFVLGQWRSCWGWMLGEGATTWWEVFDDSWSHCHLWSGSPTWQMSRYLLGLWPRFDRGDGEVDLALTGAGLEWAAGTIPLPGGQADVEWRRHRDAILWTMSPTVPLVVSRPGRREAVQPGETLELELRAE